MPEGQSGENRREDCPKDCRKVSQETVKRIAKKTGRKECRKDCRKVSQETVKRIAKKTGRKECRKDCPGK